MGRKGRLIGILGVLLGAILAAGCLLEVTHVADPGPAFAQARQEARRLAGRSGPAHHLHLLVYDKGDRQLVSASLPMSIVRELDDHGRHGSLDLDLDLDIDPKVRHRVEKHLRPKDIERAPLGILVEVEEDGGDQVLIWLS
jgi:hypothetical protein